MTRGDGVRDCSFSTGSFAAVGLRRSERFMPGHRRSRRHWTLGILVASCLLFAAIDWSIWGWWLAYGGVSIGLALRRAARIAGNLFARKVDPFKRVALGDRVLPTFPPPS